jgi:hypothetical protein
LTSRNLGGETVPDASEPRTRYTFLIGPAYDDVLPAFMIDAGDYADPEAVHADVLEASEVLASNKVISEMVTETVRPGAPRPTLPSWAGFRDEHVLEGRMDDTIPTSSGLRRPGGWEQMQSDVEGARSLLREQLAALARSIVPGAEPYVIADRGPARHGRACEDLSQERFGASVTVGLHLGDPEIDEVMRSAAGVLRELGWPVAEPRHEGRMYRLEAERGGYSVLFSVDERWRTATLLGRTPLFQATDDGSIKTAPESPGVRIKSMSEWRFMSDREVADLVTGLWTLDWSWRPEEAEQLVDRFSWKVVHRGSRNLMLENEFGPGFVDVNAGRVQRIIVAASTFADENTTEGRAFTQDAFARVVAAATRALGEPSSRRPGEFPEVRWRGAEATVTVRRSSAQVDIELATNESVDDEDWAASRGL